MQWCTKYIFHPTQSFSYNWAHWSFIEAQRSVCSTLISNMAASRPSATTDKGGNSQIPYQCVFILIPVRVTVRGCDWCITSNHLWINKVTVFPICFLSDTCLGNCLTDVLFPWDMRFYWSQDWRAVVCWRSLFTGYITVNEVTPPHTGIRPCCSINWVWLGFGGFNTQLH